MPSRRVCRVKVTMNNSDAPIDLCVHCPDEEVLGVALPALLVLHTPRKDDPSCNLACSPASHILAIINAKTGSFSCAHAPATATATYLRLRRAIYLEIRLKQDQQGHAPERYQQKLRTKRWTRRWRWRIARSMGQSAGPHQFYPAERHLLGYHGTEWHRLRVMEPCVDEIRMSQLTVHFETDASDTLGGFL